MGIVAESFQILYKSLLQAHFQLSTLDQSKAAKIGGKVPAWCPRSAAREK